MEEINSFHKTEPVLMMEASISSSDDLMIKNGVFDAVSQKSSNSSIMSLVEVNKLPEVIQPPEKNEVVERRKRKYICAYNIFHFLITLALIGLVTLLMIRQGEWASKNHRHDDLYAFLTHNHDSTYSLLSHFHTGSYTNVQYDECTWSTCWMSADTSLTPRCDGAGNEVPYIHSCEWNNSVIVSLEYISRQDTGSQRYLYGLKSQCCNLTVN